STSPVSARTATAGVATRALRGLASGTHRMRLPVVANVSAAMASATAISGTTGIAVTMATTSARHGRRWVRSNHQTPTSGPVAMNQAMNRRAYATASSVANESA